MAKFEIGMKWGRLVVVNAGWEYRTADGVKEPVDWVVIKCACNKVWKMDQWDVNRHLMKSCGECTVEVEGRVKVKSDRKPGRPVVGKSKSVAIMVSLPEHLVKEAKERLCGGEVSFSGLLAECLEERLNHV